MRLVLSILCFALVGCASHTADRGALVERLPPEELRLHQNRSEFVIQGPTFTYHVGKTGAPILNGLSVVRDKNEVISGPGRILVDGFELGPEKTSAETTVVSKTKGKVVLQAKGMFQGVRDNDRLEYRMVETFFNDGVVVLEVNLIPTRDFEISK